MKINPPMEIEKKAHSCEPSVMGWAVVKTHPQMEMEVGKKRFLCTGCNGVGCCENISTNGDRDRKKDSFWASIMEVGTEDGESYIFYFFDSYANYADKVFFTRRCYFI